MSSPSDALVQDLLAALRATLPYVLDSARRHETMGLGEEAAAARAVHGRAQWAIRAAGGDTARRFEPED